MTLEYSGNLRNAGGFTELCGELARFMSSLRVNDLPVFPPGGVRVRAIPCDEFSIADGSLPDAGFVHAVLKIGAGRSDAAKQATCNGLFDMSSTCGLALSLELNEFSEAGTLKHNNLHAHFKKS
jgi:5-carboxymethyl-2-hydroxymuconate isomerase